MITIIGCGFSGLTTAIRLLEVGHEVEIIATDPPTKTTSVTAGAVWFPFVVQPMEQAIIWGRRGYEVLEQLSLNGSSGNFMNDFTIIDDPVEEAPWWAAAFPREGCYRRLNEPQANAARFLTRVPFCSTAQYLEFLLSWFERLGGRISYRRLNDLTEVGSTDWVINCAGLGARELVGDQSLYPIRGQIVKLAPSPAVFSIADFRFDYSDNEQLAYIFARPDAVICGGTLEVNNDSLIPRPAEVPRIIRDCVELCPAVADLEILETYVGLRPARPSVRLEREPGTKIIHNYGHGGSGYTISWGCAEEVVRLVG
ncbi:MAG: FAD-dependent oxidoreductase [Bacteroidota bacterium]